MRITKLAAVAAPLACLATPAMADEDTQYWQTANVSVALSPTVRVSNELVARSSEARGFYELENVTMLNYKVTKQITIAAGYVHNPTYLHGDFAAMERRAREQVTYDNFAKLGPVKLTGRIRMEQRWRDNVAGTGWRLRPFLKVSMPLIGKASLNLTHESFINLNTTTFQKVDGYDRMRNAVFVSAPLNKQVSVDFGYLNQLGIVRGGADKSDHVITAGVSANF
ncbi:DUF2490 domain-containing protein [Novosphingobium aquiterrae]|uniref:DUF2490 domain-containing protein n=1 Tax=Novosphingobium aquiterrae TaxID=624388 RepID=A0ABV6PNA8_9SPHN